MMDHTITRNDNNYKVTNNIYKINVVSLSEKELEEFEAYVFPPLIQLLIIICYEFNSFFCIQIHLTFSMFSKT